MAPEAAMAKWETPHAPVLGVLHPCGKAWKWLSLIAGLGIISGSQTIGDELLLPRRIRGCKKRQPPMLLLTAW
jgi:hypothetical protein